jgi:hypothetical protein
MIWWYVVLFLPAVFLLVVLFAIAVNDDWDGEGW